MKRSKALYDTNSDTSDNINLDNTGTLEEAYGDEKGDVTSENSYDRFNDLYPGNWSHGTCTCNRSAGKCREASHFTTALEQMQSKSFNNVGIGNVKTVKKRKVKKIYLPETEDRATGTLDLSSYRYPNCQHFNSTKEYKRETPRKSDKSVGQSFKRHALNKELSPYIQKKIKYAIPQSNTLGKSVIGKRLHNTFSIDNFINATTQINSAELGRARKIKIFKEREVNTETFHNVKLDDSESELSIDLSTVLSNKKPNDVSSVDSLVQHVYNLDKQRHNGNFSQISVDPMENILEREYRKMFSEQSRDCVYAKKSVSDSLLRRFEALRGSMSKNVPIKKISSQLTEPNYKDVSVVSDHQSIKSQSNVKKKLSPLPSVELEKILPETQASKKKILTHIKTQNSQKKNQASIVESGSNRVKGKFKLWGKILSQETSLKKSKLKCSLKGKSLRSVKSGKISSEKSEVKKERNKKFIFFKKRDSTKALKPKKAITAGRCEIREGLTLRIQKGCPRQNHKMRVLKESHENCEKEDFPFYDWLDKLKFVDSWNSYIPSYLNLNNKRGSISNDSSETNILLCKNGATNTMSSTRKKNNTYTDFAKQYIQAWMIPNIILDGFGKANIYCNVKCEKYNKKDHSKKPRSLLSKQETAITEGPFKIYKTIYVGNASVEGELQSSSGCIRCDIGLECISESKKNSYYRKHSDEKVFNIVNYETPLPSIIDSNNIALRPDMKRNLVSNDVITDMHVKNAKQPIKQALAKPKRNGGDVALLNNISYEYNGKSVGAKQDANFIRKRDRIGTNDYDDIDGFHPNTKKKLKYAEIYLRKFCHDCVPIDINSMCSNSVVNQDMVSSIHNVQMKNKKWKPYPKSLGDIRVSTIFSSSNAAANLGQEITKVKESLNGKKKDKLGIDTTIRIIPKDSLEVFKKRQLYFNSNKNKWNELSMSVSSLSKRSQETLRSVKCHTKHVTISELGSTIQCKRSLLLKTSKTEDGIKNSEKGGKMANKNSIHVRKEEDKKTYSERGCVTEPSKNIFKECILNKLFKQFFIDKKYSSEGLYSVKKDTKVQSNIADKSKISPFPQTFACSGTISTRQNFYYKASKVKSKLLGFHFKKHPLIRKISRACLSVKDFNDRKTGYPISAGKYDNNANKKMVDGNRVNKSTNMPSSTTEEVPRIPKEVTAKSSKITCVSNLPKKQRKENIEDAGNLIEINLEIQRKPGEDKNVDGSVINSLEKTKKGEKVKGVPNNAKKNINILQDDSSKKLRSKNSNTFIKLRILIKNFNYNKEASIKNPQNISEICKQTPKNLQTVSIDKCVKSSDNIRSIYQLNSLNSFVNFNDDHNSKSDANLNLLEEQNKENSRNSEISCECVVSSQDSISKQSISIHGKEENIDNVENIEDHKFEINGRRTICENFQHSKIAFKTHAYLNPYKKLVSNYKLSNTKTKVICKHGEKYTSAQQAIQRMFECTHEVKNNRNHRKIKKPEQTSHMKWGQLCDRVDKRSRIERTTQTCKLQLHCFSSNSKRQNHLNSHLYSNQKSNLKYHNYRCQVVLTASKCRKSKRAISKCQKRMCKTIATTSRTSNLNNNEYQTLILNPNCEGEYENICQELSDHSITQENCCNSSNNTNNNGDGNFKLIPILKTDYTNNCPRSSKYSIEESISVQRCNNEEIDIFELREVKEAVLEMYVMEKKLGDSDLFTTLPEFVNEVENNLRDSIINDYYQLFR